MKNKEKRRLSLAESDGFNSSRLNNPDNPDISKHLFVEYGSAFSEGKDNFSQISVSMNGDLSPRVEKKIDNLSRIDPFAVYSNEDINNHYNIGKQIGESARCTVFLGYNKFTSQKRAIKVIPMTGMDEIQKENMLNEIKFLKTLDHPNIVKLFEYYISDKNVLYLVLEYCKGEELNNLLKNSLFPYNEQEAGIIIFQIVKAIFYMHQNGLTHRGLNPENIMVCVKQKDEQLHHDSLVKIIDLGTTTKFKVRGGIKDLVGSVHYVAPEVVRGDVYNELCDIWSMGVILFFMITSKTPFEHGEGQSSKEIFNNILACDYQFPGDNYYPISDEIKNLINKMLQKKPGNRISSKELFSDPWFSDINSLGYSEAIQYTCNKEIFNVNGFSNHPFLGIVLYDHYVKTMIDDDEKVIAQKIFTNLDKDGTGNQSLEDYFEIILDFSPLKMKDFKFFQNTLQSLNENLFIKYKKDANLIKPSPVYTYGFQCFCKKKIESNEVVQEETKPKPVIKEMQTFFNADNVAQENERVKLSNQYSIKILASVSKKSKNMKQKNLPCNDKLLFSDIVAENASGKTQEKAKELAKGQIINYSEFVTVCLNRKDVLNSARIKKFFDCLRKGQSDINKEAQKCIFDRKGHITDDMWEEYIKDVVQSKSGQIRGINLDDLSEQLYGNITTEI